MKKGEIYEAIVEKVEFPNKGIVHVGEEKVIVKNAIPGQKIQFVINKKRNGKCEGRLLEVFLIEIRHIHTIGNRHTIVISTSTPYVIAEDIAFLWFMSVLLS